MTQAKYFCCSVATRLGLVAALALSAVGCGGSKKATLHGKVTLNGSTPVTGGTIKLYPEDGKGEPFAGSIRPDGTYEIAGVSPGKKQVAIETESVKNSSPGGAGGGGGGGGGPPTPRMPKDMKPPKDMPMPQKLELDTSNLPKYVKIPAKYANPKTSGITVEITKGKKEENFDLTGK